MNLTKKNLFKYIANFEKDINDYIKQNSGSEQISSFDELTLEFDKISTFIINDNNIPESVLNFISAENFEKDAILPTGYEPIKSILNLYEFIKDFAQSNIDKAIKNKDFESVIDNLTLAIKTDIHNVPMLEVVAQKFKELNLNSELIELYKLMFVYTLNPLYFEKIGDILFDIEEYEEALDAYLNCAEGSEEYSRIYEKLAEVFGKINDNDSRIACLEHAKRIQEENG